MTDKHDAPSTEDIREMLNGAVDVLRNSEDIAGEEPEASTGNPHCLALFSKDIAEEEPAMFAWALAQCASAAYLGQIAGTLSELLAMAKAENEVVEEAAGARLA